MSLNKEKKNFIKRLSNPSQDEIDRMSYQYAIFCANFKKFHPEIQKDEYKKSFIDLLYHKWLSGMEQYDMDYLQNSAIINNTTYDLNQANFSKPLIFTTFHLGSYRLFNSFLFEKGMKIVIIIDESVYLSQQNDLLNIVKPMLKAKETSDFVILNVKDRTSIFKLKDLINQGYIMTVYLDGNTGLTEDDDEFSKSYIPINFFNKEVFVKNGIGKLASLLGADIIPVISNRDKKDNNHIEFYKEISISDYDNKQEFAVESIKKVYSIFEKKLDLYKTQWESWIYIHKWFKRNYSTSFINSKIIKNEFNHERYMFFKINKNHFLFDLLDYKSYPVEIEVYEYLSYKNFDKINSVLKEELIKKNVII